MRDDPVGPARLPPDAPPAAAGLCATCCHAQLVTSNRGSWFSLCRLWPANPRFAKYPRLPVLVCHGHKQAG